MIEKQPSSPIGLTLDGIRRQKRIRAIDIARHAGMTPQALNKVLKGWVKSPSFETVARIAKAMNVSLDSLSQPSATKGEPATSVVRAATATRAESTRRS
jgi:transcriptional regulator with XRE-family HTH domain